MDSSLPWAAMLIELTKCIMLHLAKLICINAQSIIIIIKRFCASQFHFLVSLLCRIRRVERVFSPMT